MGATKEIYWMNLLGFHCVACVTVGSTATPIWQSNQDS